MIIPIRCMNCGNPLADVWRWFQAERKRLRGANAGTPMYMDGTEVPKTVEKDLMDQLGITLYCCKKHLLTHVDLGEKV
jgi:DNA-directed RNA polymerase subunit N (RpoN/RPB10)